MTHPMQLRIEVGGTVNLVDLPPDMDAMEPVIIELSIYDQYEGKKVVRTQRVVYIRNGEIKVS